MPGRELHCSVFMGTCSKKHCLSASQECTHVRTPSSRRQDFFSTPQVIKTHAMTHLEVLDPAEAQRLQWLTSLLSPRPATNVKHANGAARLSPIRNRTCASARVKTQKIKNTHRTKGFIGKMLRTAVQSSFTAISVVCRQKGHRGRIH